MVCISIKHTALQGDGQQIGYLSQLHGASAPAVVALQLHSEHCTERASYVWKSLRTGERGAPLSAGQI